jgi:chromosome segregation ATPase
VADEEKELKNELEALREERESLKREKEVLDGQLGASERTVSELREALAARDSEITALKQTIAETEGKLSQINEALSQAVASYQEMVTAAHPEIPPELIAGDSVETVDESLQSARTLVDRVKQGIEEETSKTRVPAGAPQRAPLDLSVLSPREKIQYAIEGKR